MSEERKTLSGRFLGWVERTGNRLPDPVFIFVYLTIALIGVSLLCAVADVSAQHPTKTNADGSPFILMAESLLSAANIQKLWVEMPKTFTHFHPLGYVLVVMLGAGVAERSGLFASAMRAGVSNAPVSMLTPVVALIAMLGNHAADAAYVVLIPLAGALYAAAGRHPLAGITASFAGVSGGFSANLLPGQLDALLFGITEAAAEVVVPGYDANIAGNWYFIAALTIIYTPVIWFVTDRIIEPRLGKYEPEGEAATEIAAAGKKLSPGQKKGLVHAGIASLAICLLWTVMVVMPDAPLMGDGEELVKRLSPFFKSLVAGFLALFLAAGWAYGRAAGTIKNHRDLVKMMTEAMRDLAYYLVLSFVAAHFVAMFNWSNLGLISAVHGAAVIESSNLPLPLVLCLIVLLSATINLFVGSASAKWALLAPVMVPMMMLLGISPEGATAVYRVGDSATNIITPLMVYFPLILVFAQKWKKDFGLGSLTAAMIPYSVWMMITGLLLTAGWVMVGADLGPGAPILYVKP